MGIVQWKGAEKRCPLFDSSMEQFPLTMPALFSLGQHSALVAVQEQLSPDERLFAFLDPEGIMDARMNPDPIGEDSNLEPRW